MVLWHRYLTGGGSFKAPSAAPRLVDRKRACERGDPLPGLILGRGPLNGGGHKSVLTHPSVASRLHLRVRSLGLQVFSIELAVGHELCMLNTQRLQSSDSVQLQHHLCRRCTVSAS